MLEQVKTKLKMLIYEDSGVAMAYTVVIFSLCFLLCASTYAVTENIRQRTELQNACDAAAYSGAVVQADMLSRIAILNRALSWTYAETNKRHMDYTVDDWLQRTVDEYDSMADKAQSYNDEGNCGKGSNGDKCSCPQGEKGICWFAGANDQAAHVTLNGGSEPVAVETIRRATGSACDAEDNNIRNGYNNISVLNQEISTIRNTINASVGTAISNILSPALSTGDSFDYHLDGAWRNTNPASYIVPQTNEAQFVNYMNSTLAGELDRGTDVWWNLTGTESAVDGSWWRSNGGFARSYNQAADALVSEGDAKARQHFHDAESQSHSCGTQKDWDFRVTGQDFELDRTPAAPAKLAPAFFGAPGTILVTVKRPMVNPFTYFIPQASRGIYGAFNGPEADGRDMWVISTARAGIRLDGDPEGNYRVLFPGETSSASKYSGGEGTWNLCEEDWDAVMIPVDRAWHDASSGNWGGAPSAETILSQARAALTPRTTYSGGINRDIRH